MRIANLVVFFLLVTNVMLVAQVPKGSAHITIHAPALAQQDTLEIRVWDDHIHTPILNPHRLYKAINDGGAYHFVLDSLDGMHWFSLHFSYQRLKGTPMFGVLENYLCAEGDHVIMHMVPALGIFHPNAGFDCGEPVMLENWDFEFSGKGSEKYAVRFKAERAGGLSIKEYLPKNPHPWNQVAHLEWELSRLDSLQTISRAIVDSAQTQMRPEVYNQVLADVIGKHLQDKTELLRRQLFRPTIKDLHVDEINYLFERFVKFDEADYESDFLEQAALSYDFMWYLTSYFDVWHKIRTDQVFGVKDAIEFVRLQQSNRLLWERLLTIKFIKIFHHSSNPDLHWHMARQLITDPYSVQWLDRLGSRLNSKPAYNFSLPDLQGHYHQLSDFKGKVVLVDFWYLGCIPCRIYMQEVLRPLADYYKLDDRIRFITISTDRKEDLLRNFKEHDFLPENALHLYTEDQRFKHPIILHYGIVAYPSPMLIDQQGMVVSFGMGLKNEEEIKRLIEGLIK